MIDCNRMQINLDNKGFTNKYNKQYIIIKGIINNLWIFALNRDKKIKINSGQ